MALNRATHVPRAVKFSVYQLSVDLKDLDDVRVPTRNEIKGRNLLWADDLVLLALNGENLQKMLTVLPRLTAS